MKERSFIGVRAEHEALGIPEAVVQKPSVQEIQSIREQARKKSRSAIGKLLHRHRHDLGAAALLVYSGLIGASDSDKRSIEGQMASFTQKKPEAPELEHLPTYEAMREELEAAIGAKQLEAEVFLSQSTSQRSPERGASEHLSKHSVTMEVERSWNISNEGMQRIMQEAFPPSWMGTDAIEKIVIANQPIPMPKDYGIEGYATGVCEHGAGKEPSVIRLAPDSKPSAETIRLLSHESAHANDWKRSNTLTTEERLALLYQVHQRVTAGDRMKFSYVESIKNKNPHAEHLLKLTEYWAELMEHALIAYTPPSPKDQKLVQWYLKTVDPAFKQKDYNIRERTEQEVMREAVLERIEQELQRLPAGRTKADLIALLHRPLTDDTLERRALLTMEIAGVDLSAGHINTDPRWSGLFTPEEIKYAEALHAERDRALETWRRKESAMVEIDAYTQARYWLDQVRFMSSHRFTLSDPAHHVALHAMKGPIDTLKRDMESLSPTRRNQLEEQCHDYDVIDDVRFDIPAARPAQFIEKLKRLSVHVQVVGKDIPL